MSKSILSPRQTIHWMIDWDGTITKRDTLDALVYIAEEKKVDVPIDEKWKDVVDAYLEDYSKTFHKLVPHGQLPTNLEEEKQLLQDLEEVEQRSLDRVYDSRIFEGLTTDDLEQGAAKAVDSGRVQIREGYHEFLRARQDPDRSYVDIISVNWSVRFIQACLKAARVPRAPGTTSANDLDGFSLSQGSTGRITVSSTLPLDNVKAIVSNRHKVQVLDASRAFCDSTHSQQFPVAYIGDSWTDLECILTAELGICIRDEPMTSTQKKLADSLERLGVSCLRLKDTKEIDQWGVVWARDFHEIAEWMNTSS